MPSVLLVVFLLQVVIHIINTLGKQKLNDLLWLIYSKLPTPQSKETGEASVLKKEIIRLAREMKATSAQDEFSKWAKLRRQHDKEKAKYDNLTASQQSFRTNFDRAVSALRWLGTQGLNFFCNTWYSAQPIFWLPQGWVPYPAEWVLSFPRAPVGSISVNIWAIACASVIGMVAEGVVGAWSLREGKVMAGPRKGEVLTPMDGSRGASNEKKEL